MTFNPNKLKVSDKLFFNNERITVFGRVTSISSETFCVYWDDDSMVQQYDLDCKSRWITHTIKVENEKHELVLRIKYADKIKENKNAN